MLRSTALKLDHLMWGAADLDAGIAHVAALFGVAPEPGGAHPGGGTRNALLGLADGVYLEVIAPDPAQRLEGNFGGKLAGLATPALITFALAAPDLAGLARALVAEGLSVRGPVRMSRATPAGDRLAWELLFAGGHAFGALLPFFIDWQASPHPSAALPVAGRLEELVLTSPAAVHLGALFARLEVPVRVLQAPLPGMQARLSRADGQGAVALTASAQSLELRLA